MLILWRTGVNIPMRGRGRGRGAGRRVDALLFDLCSLCVCIVLIRSHEWSSLEKGIFNGGGHHPSSSPPPCQSINIKVLHANGRSQIHTIHPHPVPNLALTHHRTSIRLFLRRQGAGNFFERNNDIFR